MALAPSEAIDTNAFVITQQTSDDLGITTLSDLAEKGADLTLGAPPDCETNGFCIPGLMRVYGVDLTAGFQPLEFGLIPDALNQPIEVGGWRPQGVAKDAVEALVRSLQGLANVVIWLGIYVLPLALVILVPLYFILRFIFRRLRKPRATAA